MRLRIRVVDNNKCLSYLRQLNIHGKRYKIEKIQKLTENFEKTCWRSVRTSEEYAYLKKYHFLKYCVNVLNSKRIKPTHEYDNDDYYIYSNYITRIYNGENMKKCIDSIDKIINEHFHRPWLTNSDDSIQTDSTPSPVHNSTPLGVTNTIPPTSTVGLADSSSNLFSLKSKATPGDRGDDEGMDVTSSGIPVADLREAEGKLNKRADGRTKTSDVQFPHVKGISNRYKLSSIDSDRMAYIAKLPMAHRIDYERLVRMRKWLVERQTIYERHGKNLDILGYNRHELEKMIKL